MKGVLRVNFNGVLGTPHARTRAKKVPFTPRTPFKGNCVLCTLCTSVIFGVDHVILSALRLHSSQTDEFEVFVTPDGDTVWNGNDDSEPEYIMEILKKMHNEAKENDDSDDDDDREKEEEEEVPPIQDGSLFVAPSSVRMPVAWIYFFLHHRISCLYVSYVYVFLYTCFSTKGHHREPIRTY